MQPVVSQSLSDDAIAAHHKYKGRKMKITHKQEGSFEKGFGEALGNELGGCFGQLISIGIFLFIILALLEEC
jgi:hypothetical protein